MGSDLPDYTRYITANINVPESEVGPTYVAWYSSAPPDIVDGQKGPLLVDIKGRLYVVQYEKDRTVETLSGKYVRVKGHGSDEVPVTLSDQEIIARPKGGVLETDSITTTNTYQTLVEVTVTNEMDFQLAKVVVSCDEDVMVKLRWNGTDISAEIYITAGMPFTDWFPWDYYPMPGDGSKKFDIQAKYPSGGSAGTCYGEIVGEEV